MGGEEDLKQNFPFWVEVYALEVKDNSSVAHGGQWLVFILYPEHVTAVSWGEDWPLWEEYLSSLLGVTMAAAHRKAAHLSGREQRTHGIPEVACTVRYYVDGK